LDLNLIQNKEDYLSVVLDITIRDIAREVLDKMVIEKAKILTQNKNI
jgi:hypothetical protein